MFEVVSADRRSFVPRAEASDFPIQNLPYGIFSPRSGGAARAGVAIGDRVLDLAELERSGRIGLPTADRPGGSLQIFDRPTLNAFMALGRPAWSAIRRQLADLLDAENPALRDDAELRDRVLIPQDAVVMHLPAEIGDYTDFYSSREHATNVGTMFRGPENALLPNWLWVPIAYHGRASSIVVSGTEIRRPQGQTKSADEASPRFGPTRQLDLELEMGLFIGPGNALGEPIAVDNAAEHVFGLALVNDWSARDIQAWEYQPLGPFLAKNFATSLAPWVVTLDALEPFRMKGPEQAPPPLPYLASNAPWSYDIQLEVGLQTTAMNQPDVISRTNYRHVYWNLAQQIAHHTVNGCNLRPGDLLASGTISGPEKASRGCLLELTWRGAEPLRLSSGEERRFLEDGDVLSIRGWSQGEGYRVGFGEVSGRVIAARR